MEKYFANFFNENFKFKISSFVVSDPDNDVNKQIIFVNSHLLKEPWMIISVECV